jgi:hypothetical protein
VEFLLQDNLRDQPCFILGDKRWRNVAAHGIFHNLIVLGAAEQNADAGVFMRALAIRVKRFQIEGQLAEIMRSFA